MNGPQWSSNAIFYQIFPERFANGDQSNDPSTTADWSSDLPTRENFFGGDLAGIIQKVPYLLDLGINALYLTPIFLAGSNHKYDTYDYLSIDPSFGTLGTFHQLRDTLNDAEIRLVLDAVFNHCGDGFWAFQDVIQHGADSPYFEWFLIDSLPLLFDPPNYQTCGGAGFLPKLNTDHPAVRDYLLQVTEYWLKEGIDGWRLDVPWKASMEFWQQFHECVVQSNPDAYIVAEIWRNPLGWLNGDIAHGVMNYRLRQNILDYAAFDHMDAEDFDYELQYLLREYPASTRYNLTLLGSHDTPRIRTLCDSTERTIIAIVLQMTLPGVPMIYYGDEIGMEGDNDPDCRRPMIWDTTQWDHKIHDVTRKLIQLRHTHSALAHGDLHPLRVFNGVYAYSRTYEKKSVLVVLNPRGAQTKFKVPTKTIKETTELLDILSGIRFTVEQQHIEFHSLPAHSAYVFIPVN